MPNPGSSGAGRASSPTRGADQPPVVQRLIVRYAKRGRMRFASHRDIARAVERGVRRAGLPIAYSAGFTPHPKISYAGAAPTGTASEAEYLELSLTAACVGSEVRDRLDAALPDGIDVIDVTEEAGSLGARTFEASLWQVVLPGIGPDEAAAAVEAFLASDGVEVERLTSKGIRRMDARAAVVTMEADWRAARIAERRVCHTSNGCSAADTCRPARRHPGCASPGGRPRAVVTTAGDPAGAGTARGHGSAAAAVPGAGLGHTVDLGHTAGHAAAGAAQGHVETTRLEAPPASWPRRVHRARTTSSCAERRVPADLRAREPDGR